MPEQPGATLADLAEGTATTARGVIATVELVATGGLDDAVLPLLLMALGRAATTSTELTVLKGVGVRIPPQAADEAEAVWPPERADQLRRGLAAALAGVDEYDEVVDPVVVPQVRRAALSSDLSVLVRGLGGGLVHHDAGRLEVALAVWQETCWAQWGDRATSALRALLALARHVQTGGASGA